MIFVSCNQYFNGKEFFLSVTAASFQTKILEVIQSIYHEKLVFEKTNYLKYFQNSNSIFLPIFFLTLNASKVNVEQLNDVQFYSN